ncbi:MAG: hypothetical protein V1797_18570 [Pseudomonadota bacterium]
MLVAFFKLKKDANVSCEISKFIDRMWIHDEGDLTCIRSFIVHVYPESPAPLSALRILVPYRVLKEVEDISETCLNMEYLFNNKNFSTGGYDVNRVGVNRNYGMVMYDYFNTSVYSDNAVSVYPGE